MKQTSVEDILKIINRYFPEGKGLRSNDKHVQCMYAILKELDIKDIDHRQMDGMSALTKKKIK